MPGVEFPASSIGGQLFRLYSVREGVGFAKVSQDCGFPDGFTVKGLSFKFSKGKVDNAELP